MSEKHLKLKLKRKRAAIQEDKSEQHSSIPVKKSAGVPIQFSSSESDLRSETTGDPYDSKPGVWWDRPDLQAVEKLWAVTLKSAIPNLGHGVWETVPDLPLASPVTCSAEEPNRWKWCSLGEEVGPLPSPPKPPVSSSANLDGRGPNHKVRPVYTSPVSDSTETPPDLGPQNGRLSSVPTQEEAGEGTSVRNPEPPVRRPANVTGRQPRNPFSLRKVLMGGTGRGERDERSPSSGDGGHEGNRTAGRALLEGARGGGAEGAVIKRRLPAHAAAGSDSSAPEQQHRTIRPPVGQGDVSGTPQNRRNSAGGAAAAMETCPMCLLPFPSGFTQMECDSHLAKCLSEMSEDITW
ncbi:hypothetical protein COCON_G00140490 [Conger conger]|uniref:UBZ2-type domain-containing protein n=1 Tax=Conger conger TaxID=82655 RepID=A0A9Q1HVJ4_CONCO|nr:hypothetical protein COCON_G00140490 [Conger conger]